MLALKKILAFSSKRLKCPSRKALGLLATRLQAKNQECFLDRLYQNDLSFASKYLSNSYWLHSEDSRFLGQSKQSIQMHLAEKGV